jgi:hypothetical protein
MRANGLLLCILIYLVAGTVQAQSEPYVVGDRIPQFSLQDQHQKDFAVDASARILLFSRDMDGGRLLEEALADTDQEFLSGANAIYVSDISGMPALIARMFAIPSMRKRTYSMLLDRSGDVPQRIPDVEERATVSFLNSLQVERIEHVDSANAVRSLLELDPLSDDDS